VFQESTTTTTASLPPVILHPAPIISTSQLFKKQRVCFNPSYPPQEVSNNVASAFTQNEAVNDDNDNAFLNDDNFICMDLSADNNFVDDFVSTHGSIGAVGSHPVHVYNCTPQLPPGECHYTSFTTTQKCVTSLMYLLDEMECPDYAFQHIMEWARKCFEAGFLAQFQTDPSVGCVN
jgi:hypothetical protein